GAAGAELVALGPGVLGASICRIEAGRATRWLVPIDGLGQPLGAPLEIGAQLGDVRCRPSAAGPVPDCPPGTLVPYPAGESVDGSAGAYRILSSQLEGGEVRIREIVCDDS